MGFKQSLENSCCSFYGVELCRLEFDLLIETLCGNTKQEHLQIDISFKPIAIVFKNISLFIFCCCFIFSLIFPFSSFTRTF